MGRRLFNLASAVSAIVCAGLMLSWGRAQFGDEVWVRCVGNRLMLYGADGTQAGVAETYYFDPRINITTFEGSGGLLRMLRTVGLYSFGSARWSSRGGCCEGMLGGNRGCN